MMDKATMFRSQNNEEFPARTAFWGIRCEPGKKYSQVVRQKFRITNAALEPSEVTTRTTENFVSLMAVHGGQEYLLCSLQQKNIMQVNLNLVFDQGDNLIFHLKGQGRVHLSGYLISDGDEPCPLKISAVPDSPQLKQNQNLKKKSLLNQPAVKDKEVVTAPDNIDEESSNEKTTPKKRKAKAQLTSNAVKKKGNADKVLEDEQVEEVNMQKTKKKAVKAESGTMRLWDTLQKRRENDEEEDDDEDDDDDDEEEEEEGVDYEDVEEEEDGVDDEEEDDSEEESEEEKGNSKDRLQSKVLAQKLAKTDSKLKQKENFHTKSAEVVDLEEEESSSSGGLQELNSSIGRTPMPNRKMTAIQSLCLTLPQFKSPEIKVKKQKNEKRDSSLLKGHKGNAVEKPFGKKLVGGVDIQDIRIGSGPPAKVGKFVHIYYIGKLPTGEVFDSRKPNEKPFSFRLGKGEVMHGMEIGIEDMRVGGKRKIKIPPELGMGKKGGGAVPPNSPLLFIVELKAVS